jgi:hypothetical protein
MSECFQKFIQYSLEQSNKFPDLILLGLIMESVSLSFYKKTSFRSFEQTTKVHGIGRTDKKFAYTNLYL